eukprot:CAMPEP_0117434934 /NCGR_PEP_ID=MMETSP0759-20121206/212_1 /TAXON_ID=63605 /ORGANISM="Percolomonas cosmopolitus, Strain WS" /LENGTH=1933 /DNA_ID=CAMNT_0005226447 /DNA_START=116 /DNA_END=5917 /DNA_ORIENTATION=-
MTAQQQYMVHPTTRSASTAFHGTTSGDFTSSPPQEAFLAKNDKLFSTYVNEQFARKYNSTYVADQHLQTLRNAALSTAAPAATKWLSLQNYVIECNNSLAQSSTPNNDISIQNLLNIMKWCCIALERLHKEYIVHLALDLDAFRLKVNSQNPHQILDCQLANFHYSQVINNRNSRIQPSLHILPNSLQKLLYSSPEATQRSTDIDQFMDFRSDLYSLGVIFYRLASGRDLFANCLIYEDLVDAHNYTEVLPITQLREDFPFVMQEMIGKMLEKLPTHRYTSVFEIVNQIQQCQDALQNNTMATLDLDSNYRHLKPVLTNFRNEPQMLVSPLNCSRKNHYKTIEKTFLKSRSGTPGVVLISGVPGIGKKNTFHVLSGQYRYSCLFASTFFTEKSVAHAPLVMLARQVVDQIMRFPEHKFENVSQLVRDRLGVSHEQLLTSVIPELSTLFGKPLSTSGYLPEPEISSSVGDALCSFLKLFCEEDRHLCVFVERIDLAGTFCWKIFDSLLKPNHNFLLIGSCGASKEERLIIKANYRRLRKSGVHVNNCQLDVPKTSALKSMILSTLMGVPGTSIETSHANHAPMSPSMSPASGLGYHAASMFPALDDNFRAFAELIISKSNNKPIKVIEILLYLKEMGLIVPHQQPNASTDPQKQPLMWTPKWKEVILHLSTNSPNFISRNFSKLPPVTQQILEIASVLEAPFTLDDLSRFTKKDEAQVFADLFPALCEGWITNEGFTYVFAHARYLNTVLSTMDKPKVDHYLDEIIIDTLSHLKENQSFLYSDYIFHVIQWITKRFAASKEENTGDNNIYKEYLEDFARLTAIACRKLLAANLPKTANNYAAQVYEILERSRLTIDANIQFELDYVFCRVQFAMGNFGKCHSTAMKLIDQDTADQRQQLRVLSVLLVNGMSFGKHNQVIAVFLKRCSQLRLLSEFSEPSVKRLIAQKQLKLESLLIPQTSVENLVSSFVQEDASSVLDTDSLDADLKSLVEVEGLIHLCKTTNMQHYILFGLTCLEYVFDARHIRPSTAVAIMYGTLALNQLSLSSSSSKLTTQHLKMLVAFADKIRERQMSTLRYDIKFQRFQLCMNPNLPFDGQHKQLLDMRNECTNSKEPSFLIDFQDLLISCMSGVHATDIVSTLNKLRIQQNHLRHNPVRTAEIQVIASAAKRYIEALQDVSFQFQQQQANVQTNITPASNTFATLTSSITPETPSSLSALMSFSDPMRFSPQGDHYGLIHTFALGRLSHHLFGALFFFVTNQSSHALREIQKVLSLRDVVGGNIIDELISFFIVRIAAENFNKATSEKIRSQMQQLISQEVRTSERYASQVGKAVHYYCRAKQLKCNSKSCADIQYLQLLQKSIRLAHDQRFSFLIGVVSVHLVETLQELEFSETLINSTMVDALEAWKSVGGVRLLRKIRENHADVVDRLSKIKPTPIVLPSLESITQISDTRQNSLDVYFVQCLAENGIDISALSTKTSTVTQEMTVVSISIRQFEKVIHHKSSQEIFDIVAEYVSRVGLVLRKFSALHEVLQNTRIIAYFPNSIRHAVQAVIEINDSIKDLRQGRMNKPNSTFIRISCGIHQGPVTVGHLNRDVKPEFGRIDTNYGAMFFTNMEQLLWYEQLANAFNLTIIGSDMISDFIGDSSDIGSRYLGKFRVENSNSGGQLNEPALSIYEIYNKEWKKGTNYREFNRSIQMFKEKKFVSCANIFSRVSKGSYSSDGLPDHVAKLYVDVCRMYKQITLPENWEGDVLLSSQVKPLPIGSQNSSFYLQRGISTAYNDEKNEDSSMNKSQKDAHMLQQSLDQKNASLTSMNDLLAQKEDLITDLQSQRETLETEKKDLSVQLNKLRSELAKEQKIRRRTERKNLVLTHNGGFKLLGCVPVPSALLVSPTEGRKSSNRVHNSDDPDPSTPPPLNTVGSLRKEDSLAQRKAQQAQF